MQNSSGAFWGELLIITVIILPQGGEKLLHHSPDRNYCVTHHELLAVVAAFWHFRGYLYGQPFLLRTDHASLTWLLNIREPEGELNSGRTTSSLCNTERADYMGMPTPYPGGQAQICTVVIANRSGSGPKQIDMSYRCIDQHQGLSHANM